MTPDDLASTIASGLDGEYDDEASVFYSATAEGPRVRVRVSDADGLVEPVDLLVYVYPSIPKEYRA